MDGPGLRPSSPKPKPYVGPAQPGPIQGFGGLRAGLQFGGGPSLGPKPGLSLYNSVYLTDTKNDATPELSSHHTTTTGPKLMPVPASTTALKRDAQQAALESSPESDHADHEGVTQTMRRKQAFYSIYSAYSTSQASQNPADDTGADSPSTGADSC
ncbi:hypothetical protein BU15DRAFT_66875 [Melanogaster broomeanus]|nr:hypothetical protein BU15DRAFT_66875 [Melanogaster broomeanus]